MPAALPQDKDRAERVSATILFCLIHYPGFVPKACCGAKIRSPRKPGRNLQPGDDGHIYTSSHGTKTQSAEWSDSFDPRPRNGAGNWSVSLCLFVPTKKPQISGNGVVERQDREDLEIHPKTGVSVLR